MVKKHKMFVILVLISSLAFSFDWDAHEYAAREICDFYDCGECLPQILNGSITPDKYFRDTVNHHCYDLAYECPEGDWTCPTEYDCPALEKTQLWLQKAENYSLQNKTCDYYYAIGVASHYYLDSKVFWHQVKYEDYEQCHKPFESSIGEHLKKNESSFTVTKCGVSITKAEIDSYISSFKVQLGRPIPKKDNNINSFGNVGNFLSFDFESNQYFYIVAIIILLVIAIIVKKKRIRFF